MKGKILTWDEFREYCKEDAYHWHVSGYKSTDVTEEDILGEYSEDYFEDDSNADYDDLSSCFTAKEFASKTLEYLREIENEERKGKNMIKVKTFFFPGGRDKRRASVKMGTAYIQRYDNKNERGQG